MSKETNMTDGKMTWREAVTYMREYNRKHGFKCGNPPDKFVTIVAVMKPESFTKEYSLEERSYAFSNDNKAFLDGMGGYSIFSYCLDGIDNGVRLEGYVDEEGGGGVWKVDYCYIKSED